MATRAKRHPPAKGSKPARSIEAPPKSPNRPSFRFYHSEELHQEIMVVLTTIESARDPTAHRNDLAEVAVKLTSSGLHYYFVKPLKIAKAGFILEQSASVGMAGAQQVIGPVIRNIITRMDGPQLLSVVKSLRQFMR